MYERPGILEQGFRRRVAHKRIEGILQLGEHVGEVILHEKRRACDGLGG